MESFFSIDSSILWNSIFEGERLRERKRERERERKGGNKERGNFPIKCGNLKN